MTLVTFELTRFDEFLQVLLLGISCCPWECDQKSLTSTYGKIIVIPRPDYASLYHIWNDLLFQYSGLSRKFDVSSLAKLSDGYTIGTIIKVLQEVIAYIIRIYMVRLHYCDLQYYLEKI